MTDERIVSVNNYIYIIVQWEWIIELIKLKSNLSQDNRKEN